MAPKLFIGSSREAKEVGLLSALQAELQRGLNSSTETIKLVPWIESPWKNLSAAVATLVESLVDYSYAVFILSADDELAVRGNKHYAARDNVIFEFGLFLAHLGPERTWLVGPADTDTVLPVSSLLTPLTSSAGIRARPLRILTDLGSVYREGRYTTMGTGPSTTLKFEIEGVVRAIQRIEAKTTTASASMAQEELTERLLTARAEIGKSGRGDSYYSGQFFSRFRDIATLKARVTSKTVKDAVEDLLLYLEQVSDLCDVSQLAKEQHHRKGIKEVWVFSDSPLEFSDSTPTDVKFIELRATIRENLRNGVKYTYFVGPDFNADYVDNLVGGRDPDRDKMLKCIHVVKIDSMYFSTYFTLHFGAERAPTAIYMSSVMEKRNDLLIQVSDGRHKERIFRRISHLHGVSEQEDSPRITRYVLR